MRFAVPVHNQRISPVLDTARQLQVYYVESPGKVLLIESVEFQQESMVDRVEMIIQTGIDVLICGGVSRDMALRLQNRGIQVIPWMAGRINRVVVAYSMGDLNDGNFRMPGCRCRNQPARQQRRCRNRQRRNGGRV